MFHLVEFISVPRYFNICREGNFLLKSFIAYEDQ